MLTSLASKAGSAILQLVSLPLAAHVLGKTEFGVYATISMTITLIVLLELGVGPALALGISNANARKDRTKEKKYYATALVLISSFAVIGALIMAAVIALVPLPTLFGPNYAGLEAVMLPGLAVGLCLYTCELILSHTDQTREGYMESNHSNAWGAVGNVISAMCVGAIALSEVATIELLLMAVFGPHVVVRVLNTVFLLRKRTYLIPNLRNYDRKIAKRIIKDGLALSVSYALTVMVEFNLCALIVGRMAGPDDVAIFQVFVSITIALNGFVIMLMNPMRPAVIDAWAKGDRNWITSAVSKIYLSMLTFAVLAGIGLILSGPWGLPHWYGEEFSPPRLLFVAFAFYFLANTWRRCNQPLIVAVGQVFASAKYTLVEIGITIAAAITGMYFGGLAGLWFGVGITIFLISGWAFPRIFWKAIRSETSEKPEEEIPLPLHGKASHQSSVEVPKLADPVIP